MSSEPSNLSEYCRTVAQRAKSAAGRLALVSGAKKNEWLRNSARRLREEVSQLLAANLLDLAEAPGYGLSDAEIDRLKLSPERIEAIAAGLEEVALLPDPIGEVIESSVRPNGL